MMITASHNPPEYNGIKLKAAYGGAATPALVAEVEDHVRRLEAAGGTGGAAVSGKQAYAGFSPQKAYLDHISHAAQAMPTFPGKPSRM